MTIYFAHVEGELPKNVHTNDITWRAWINADWPPCEVTKGLALHRHLRNRGRLAVGESITVHQLVRPRPVFPCQILHTEIKLTNEAGPPSPVGKYINVMRG